MHSLSLVSASVKNSAFANTKASKSIRVCCFGSSSSETPDAYMRPSAEVGYLLGVRGHVCVNGAGSYGCMAAMNEGAVEGNGHIIGVTHEMWIKEGEDSRRWGLQRPLKDTGAHPAFASSVPHYHGSVDIGSSDHSTHEPIRQLLVATGKDLQERKKLLIDNSDALIVMPGGPGTFDEVSHYRIRQDQRYESSIKVSLHLLRTTTQLWEMACARNLGLSTMPLVCVNTHGFYDSFRVMLERAWDDRLTKLPPEQIMHFADTAEEAIRWVEQAFEDPDFGKMHHKKSDKEILRHSSALGNTSIVAAAMPANVDFNQFLRTFIVFAIGFTTGGILMKMDWTGYEE